MTRCSFNVVLFISVVIAGCSSGTTSPPEDGGHAAHEGGMHEDSGPTPPVDGGSEAAAGKPVTPQILTVDPMAGSLHVTWKTNDTALTGVELWRKKDTGTYAKAYTLPGMATSQHDTAGTAPGTYCYQVKTIRGTDESEFSPEKCGTP